MSQPRVTAADFVADSPAAILRGCQKLWAHAPQVWLLNDCLSAIVFLSTAEPRLEAW